MTIPGFAVLVKAIVDVNRDMHLAAQNPMDKWRRQRVRQSIAAMPPAIMALAAEFKKGKLHDPDLPVIQKMLGGFVDVNVASKFNQFLEKPDSSLIPQVGSDFPGQLTTSSEGSGPSSLEYDESASGQSAASGAASSTELVQLTGDSETPSSSASSSAASTRSPTSGGEAALEYNEGAARGVSAATSEGGLSFLSGEVIGQPTPVSGSNSPQGKPEFLRDLFWVESDYKGEDKNPKINSDEEAQKEDELLDEEPAKKRKDKIKGMRKRDRASADSYRIEAKPRYWRVPKTKLFGSLLFPTEAKAERIADPDLLELCLSRYGTSDLAECEQEMRSDRRGYNGYGGGGKFAGLIAMAQGISSAIAYYQTTKIQAQRDVTISKIFANYRVQQEALGSAARIAASEMQKITALQNNGALLGISALQKQHEQIRQWLGLSARHSQLLSLIDQRNTERYLDGLKFFTDISLRQINSQVEWATARLQLWNANRAPQTSVATNRLTVVPRSVVPSALLGSSTPNSRVGTPIAASGIAPGSTRARPLRVTSMAPKDRAFVYRNQGTEKWVSRRPAVLRANSETTHGQ